MRETTSGILRLVSFLLLTLAIALGSEAESASMKAAERWLAYVDTGKYGESWDNASKVFKDAITKERWIEALGKVREQVGKFENRKFLAAQAVTDPPNSPPGEYVIFQYSSNFVNKHEAVETVVMSIDPDKQWRTSGYFVK